MVFRAFLAPRIGGDCCCWSGRSQFRFKERGQSKLLPFHFGNWVAALVPAIVCSTLAEPRKYASFWMVHREVAEDRRVLCRLECDPGLTAIGQKCEHNGRTSVAWHRDEPVTQVVTEAPCFESTLIARKRSARSSLRLNCLRLGKS